MIITGGVSGIGRSTAIAFARERPTVVIGDLDKTGGEKTASTIKDVGMQPLCASIFHVKPLVYPLLPCGSFSRDPNELPQAATLSAGCVRRRLATLSPQGGPSTF